MHGMTSSLGPQCLTCKKRQVKCDSTEPSCNKCRKDGKECRGYGRSLKFVAYDPAQKKQSQKPTKGRTPGERLEVTFRKPSQDVDYLALLESFEYFEHHVVPYMMPVQQPFHRPKIDRHVPWHVLPKLLLHCMILSLRSMRANIVSSDPAARKDLCHYRGLSLASLQKALPDAVSDPSGVALGCVLLMMGADVAISPIGSWSTHFEAAQRIISLRGGIQSCLHDQPQAGDLLLRFILADIFSSSTCHSKIVANSFSVQHEYAEFLVDKQGELLGIGCVCPAAILQVIARINLSRAGTNVGDTFEKIWTSIQAFHPRDWAAMVLKRVRSHGPDIIDGNEEQTKAANAAFEGLDVLAECFQLTSFLYLGFAGIGASNTSLLPSLWDVKKTLNMRMGYIISLAEDKPDAPLRAQLWKFLSWPLFVSAYVAIWWEGVIMEGQGFVNADDEINRFRATRVAQGSTNPFSADFLSQLQYEISQKGSWDWDLAFPYRCGFTL